ncbi:hypothetical protein [Pseudomonas nitroreducens]|nr:hypothetical protein [Pseudomonas nitritireducens]
MAQFERSLLQYDSKALQAAFPIAPALRTHLRKSAKSSVESNHYNVPHHPALSSLQTKWVGCHTAPPHVDAGFIGKRFITLVIEADHVLFEVQSVNKCRRIHLEGGELFVFDPLKLHWLEQQVRNSKALFFTLQWEVMTDAVPEAFAMIRDALSGIAALQGKVKTPAYEISDIL